MPDQSSARLLSPAIPPIVPAVPADAIGERAALPVRGYIDVGVEITRFGRVKRVEILEKSSGTSKAIEKRLRRYLGASVFRPRFVGGQLARFDRFDARFYFRY